MALLMMQGWDISIVPGELAGEPGWSGTVYATLGYNSGRRSSQAMQLSGSGHYGQYDIGAEKTTLILGFAFYPGNDNATPGTFLWRFQDSANADQFIVDRTAAGRLRVLTAPAGSVLAESADGVITEAIYQYVEIKLVCDASTGSVTVKVGGTQVINQGSINTQQAGSGGVQKIRFGHWCTSGNSPFTCYDDMVLLDDTGDAPFNDFLGDVKVQGVLPAADGTYEQWDLSDGTNSTTCIDDTGSSWGSHYVQTTTLNEKDSFTLDSAGVIEEVLCVEVRTYWKNPETGLGGLKHFLRIDGTIYYGAEITHGDTNLWQTDWWYENPDSDPAAAFTQAIIDGMEFGFELTSQA